MRNLGKEKSDTVDAAMLASTPWMDKNAFDKPIHKREHVSELTRLHESVTRNITRVTNILKSDLVCIFPEYMDMFSDVGSKTPLAILDEFSTPSGILKAGMDKVLKTMGKTSRNHYSAEGVKKLINLAKETIGIPDRDGGPLHLLFGQLSSGIYRNG